MSVNVRVMSWEMATDKRAGAAGNGARVSELEYVLNKVSCKALVITEGFRSSDYPRMLRELAPEIDDGNKRTGVWRGRNTTPMSHRTMLVSIQASKSRNDPSTSWN